MLLANQGDSLGQLKKALHAAIAIRYNYYVQLVVIERNWTRVANLNVTRRGEAGRANGCTACTDSGVPPPACARSTTPNLATSAAKLVCKASRKGCSTWPGLEPWPNSCKSLLSSYTTANMKSTTLYLIVIVS